MKKWDELIQKGDFEKVKNKLINENYSSELLNKVNVPQLNALNKKIRVAILSSYTIQNIKKPLQFSLLKNGFSPKIKFGEYNQYVQELLDTQSAIYQFSPDIILLALDNSTFLENIEYKYLEMGEEEQNAFIENKVGYIKKMIDVLCQNSNAHLIITNLEIPDYSPWGIRENNNPNGLRRLVRKINDSLIKITCANKQITILDFEKIVNWVGKKNITDQRFYSLGKIYLSDEATKEFIQEFVCIVNAIYGHVKKCLVLDLDNTLWGGVIGEDGIENIKLGGDFPGSIYKEAQKAILNLHKNGVILAINSKNNIDDIKPMFSHPEMVLKEKHFGCIMTNWNDKASNIIQIAKELNIGIDSLVFLDDNPAERGIVKESLPEVIIPEFPKDIAELPSMIKKMRYFEVIELSEEDKKRGEMYFAQRKRKELMNVVHNKEDYLKDLEIKIEVQALNDTNIGRITQLINKTNQFNLRTKRYTQEEVKKFAKENNIYCVKVLDKFGDSGITGVIMIKDRKDNYFIENFLLSCRVMSRDIENEFLRLVLSTLNNKPVYGEFIQTKKNTPVKDIYSKLGFEKESENNWVLKKNIAKVAWIEGRIK